MLELAFLFVLVACVYSVYRLHTHQRALRTLKEAIKARRPFLLDDIPGALGKPWDELCSEASALTIDMDRLNRRHTGQLAQLEATLGSLQEAVLIIDYNNYVLLANRALHAMFPRVGEILGQRVERVVHSDSFLRLIDTVRRGDPTARQEIEILEGNLRIWIEVTGTSVPPLDGGKHPGLLFVLHDITRQKKLESIRKEFVANVSHELRTPLAVIKGYVETMVDERDTMPADDRSRFLLTIQRHTERLNSLLEDLLTLSRLESNGPALSRERVDPAAFLKDVLNDFSSRPAAAGHQLTCEVDPTTPHLCADPLRLGQIFDNLLSNALKYTPRGCRIQLSARPGSGDTVEFEVRDNGPGIPQADLPHIFERFYRVDKGRSREKGGTGLGLSIVKHIVQMHGGRIWAECPAEGGTVFTFILPLRANGQGLTREAA